MRSSLAGFFVAANVLLALCGREASAQEVEGPAPPPASVRVDVRSARDDSAAHVFVRQPDGGYALLCITPCAAQAWNGSELRISMNGEPHDYTVRADAGKRIELEVLPPSRGAVLAGSLLMGGGALFALTGWVVNKSADDTYTCIGNTCQQEEGDHTTGYVLISLGAAMAVGGLMTILLAQSHETRVRRLAPTDRQAASPTPARPRGLALAF